MSKFYKYNELMVNNIKWEYPEEEAIFQWTNRKLSGSKKDIKFRKAFCYTLIGFMLLIPLILATTADSFLDLIACIIIPLIILIPFILMTYFGILGGNVYRYRITSQYIEVASWRDEVQIMKAILKILLWIAFCFLLVFFIINPSSLLVGLGGIVGIGIMAGATLYSKSYAKTNLQYKQVSAPLDSIVYKQIDTAINLIAMEAKVKLGTKKIREVKRAFTIFCTEDNFQTLQTFLKEKNTHPELEVVYGEMYKN